MVTPVPVATAAYGVEFGVGSPAYTLDSGDRLRVVVFGQEGLTNSYAVDIAGNVTLPLIGPVRARGHTTTEVSAAVVARLRQGFLREPHVAVEVEAYRPFFILGEVSFPGQYPYVANMTVETAVAIAGGFQPARIPPQRRGEPPDRRRNGPPDGPHHHHDPARRHHHGRRTLVLIGPRTAGTVRNGSAEWPPHRSRFIPRIWSARRACGRVPPWWRLHRSCRARHRRSRGRHDRRSFRSPGASA